MPGGQKYSRWCALSDNTPSDYRTMRRTIENNRHFVSIDRLHYGDHGLLAALTTIKQAIQTEKKIALYADYDVDGTMSCTSWIWFLRAIGYRNFTHYIPCRFKEGYGVNLEAIKHLIHDLGAQLIVTMDTGITANVEAAYCAEQGVDFICTDHHVIQASSMPDCIILNPKQHPDAMYQELCGAGITFVLLRSLARHFPVPRELWTDILALTGMATICDMVPLNGVNHKLARMGIEALTRSERPVLRALLSSARTSRDLDEKDVGFRLGPRINAVGRLDHANTVITAFSEENPEPLLSFMQDCNLRRQEIQKEITKQARTEAEKQRGNPLLFIGGDFHPGVLGIAASKIGDEFWCPVFLFNDRADICKGSARSISGFDVTAAMSSASHLFTKFGGHKAAGGFSFALRHKEALHHALLEYAHQQQAAKPELWESKINFDCRLHHDLLTLQLLDNLDDLKPFGLGFEEPKFVISGDIAETRFYCDRITAEPAHTAVSFKAQDRSKPLKIMFFNEVHPELKEAPRASFVVTANKNNFRNVTSLDFVGKDFALLN